MVHHESVLKGRSHCASCGHPLKAADLVPVFSYLFLKGKCRYCGEKISPRYMAAELVSAALWLGCVLRYGVSWELLRAIAFICVLFVLSLVDLETYTIPNRLLAAALVIYAVTFPLVEFGLPGSLSCTNLAPEEAGSFAVAALGGLTRDLGGALLLGGGLLILSLVFDKITGKEGLGGGDIKLFFVTGLYLGALRSLLCLIVSCLVGLAFAGFRKNRKIPFGPAISIGIVLTLFFGDPVIRWYLGLL